MDTDNVDILQRLDKLHILQNLLVCDTELTIGLTCVDATVCLGVDVGVYAKTDISLLAHLACKLVYNLQLLDRLAVDSQNSLLDSITNLLIALTYARINHSLGVEARLDSLAYLVTAGAVDADTVLLDD